jgi:hypothetical protein
MDGLCSGISDEELGCVVSVLKKMENNIMHMGGANKE